MNTFLSKTQIDIYTATVEKLGWYEMIRRNIEEARKASCFTLKEKELFAKLRDELYIPYELSKCDTNIKALELQEVKIKE